MDTTVENYLAAKSMNHTDSSYHTGTGFSLLLSLFSAAVLRPKLHMKLMKLVKLLVVKTKSYLLILKKHLDDFFFTDATQM